MRAPLDRLAKQVTRFVDVSGLNKVAQGFEWIGKAAGNVFRMLSNIVPVLGAITGAATLAGMVKLVGVYADWSHTLVQTADNIGITTQNLQQFQNATRLAGGNAEDMTGSLKALHDNLADFNIGRGSAAETAQMMNYLGVSMKDANGHLRDAGDVMKELIPKIAALRDPADRARIANGLLGASGDKLVETFRQTHRSFSDWFTDAGRYKALTQEQIAANQRFTEAQGRLGVAFDTLGQQITAILTRDFGPLLERFADFVERNTPAILGAIDQLSARFAKWLGGIKWEDIETGLKTVGDNLTAIGHAVEFLVGMQLGLWFVKAAAGVAQLTAAFGSMGAGVPGMLGAVGGAGLLGVLGGVLTVIAATYLLLQKGLPALFGDRPLPLARPPGEGGAPQTTPNTTRPGNESGVGPHHGLEPSRPGGGGHGGGPRLPATSTAPIPGATGLAATPFGSLIARGEGDYDSVNRGAAGGYAAGREDLQNKTVSEVMADQAAQRYNAAGRYQIIATTMKEAVASMGLKGDEKFDQKMQDRIFGEYLAGNKRPALRDYLTGRSDDLHAAQVAAAQEWASVAHPDTGASVYGGVGNNRSSISPAEMAAALRRSRAAIMARNAAPGAAPPGAPPAMPPGAVAFAPPKPYGGDPNAPVQFPPAAAAPGAGYKTLTQEQLTGERQTVPTAPPVNGSVDVSITHKNAPPNSAVTATGSGAVNVAPVRVEHQDMASI